MGGGKRLLAGASKSSQPAAPLVLALDVGTSSCRASVYDAEARRVPGVAAQIGYAPRVNEEGGAELDADYLLQQVAETIDRVMERAGATLARVEAVATSTFWHSLMGVDGEGRAATPVYLWMDARSRGAAESLKSRLDERAIHARTGCVLHWSYLPAKLLWLSQTWPDLFRRVRRWVSFGEYMMLRLFGRAVAGVCMASGTGLFDQHLCDWDDIVLGELPIEREQLSPVGSPGEMLMGLRPEFAERWPGLKEVPWLPPLGDGACSNLGAGCTSRERFALMVGTSGALRALWRADRVEIPWGVWCYRADHRRPVLGGALNDGGSLLLWLRRTLQLPPTEAVEEAIAALEPDGHGLAVLPFWAGERSPGWALDARGAIVGIRLATTPIEIVRAAMEAVALRFAQLDAILRRAVPEVREIVATGGALLQSPAWLQIMADALGRPVLASAETEASSRGAALLALEALGRFPQGIEALVPPVERVYEPVAARAERYRAAAERQSRLYDMLMKE